MNDQTMMLILVMAFFMLGCRFSCSGMKESFDPCLMCEDTKGSMDCSAFKPGKICHTCGVRKQGC
jgi:hypothetical protein